MQRERAYPPTMNLSRIGTTLVVRSVQRFSPDASPPAERSGRQWPFSGVPVAASRRPHWLSVAILSGAISQVLPGAVVPDALEIYDQTTAIVTAKFYDRTFRGLPWEKTVEAARAKLTGPVDEEKLGTTINDLLHSLRSSHTAFLSPRDQEYWALKSIFSREIEGAPFSQIGAWFTSRDGRWFIQNIFPGSPAEKAGLLSGDEMVSVDARPFAPVQAFIDAAGREVSLAYRRSPNRPERVVAVTPETQSIQSSLLAATLASSRVIPSSGKRIGYFHLWAGTHPRFQEALVNAVREFAGTTDGLILDLRDGFGGAGPSWLNPFFDHDEEGRAIPPLYAKPLVVLINGGTRSGKEWLAFLLQRAKRATLVGTRTAGYFVAGQPFEIGAGRFLLFLAVNGDGPPGVDIEGKGVTPEIEAKFTLPYSAGEDPPLQAALQEIATRIGRG